MHEIERIDGRRESQTGGNKFRINRNKFYDRKNEIPMKTPELKRSGIRIIAEFRGIPTGFPNQSVPFASPMGWDLLIRPIQRRKPLSKGSSKGALPGFSINC
jgi:hypothetical protein